MSLRRGVLTELEPGMTFHFMTGIWQENWGLETTESILITNRIFSWSVFMRESVIEILTR